MKRLLFVSILTAGLLLSAHSRFRALDLSQAIGYIGEPCALVFQMDKRAWRHNPWVMIHFPDHHNLLLRKGSTDPILIPAGTWISVDQVQPPAQDEVIGATTWVSCDDSEAPRQVCLSAGAVSQSYVAQTLCDCPSSGYGYLQPVSTEYSTQQ